MKRIYYTLFVSAIMLAMVNLAVSCGGDDDPVAPPSPPEPGVLKVIVKSSADNSLIPNSNVVLYNAEISEAVQRDLTDPDGVAYFSVDEGNYFLDISAQGYDSSPPEGMTPTPFFVAWDDTLDHEIFLNALENAGSAGYVLGHVDPAVNNFLILAESQSTHEKYSTVTGPDGFFVLFNLPYGTYDLDALKAGYMMDDPVTASISSVAEVDTVSIPVSPYEGSVLTGQVSFLASENSVVDITLLDPETREVIPGLSVMNDEAGLTYRIEGIPDGSYIAWASLQNDGYVLDPDWLFKNPGGLDVSFTTPSTLELDFSVTDVIILVSPTNPAESTTPFMAESQTPVFKWLPYPSAKEYFIEVKDFSGNVLWGGMNADGTVNHGFIGADADSVAYNFDGQIGVPYLQPGEVYQWRLWADKGTQADSFVEQLISSSEDLRGIFQVPDNSPQ